MIRTERMRRDHCRGGVPGTDRLPGAPRIRGWSACVGTSVSRRDCAESHSPSQLSVSARICRGVTECSVARFHPEDIAHAAKLLENATELASQVLKVRSIHFRQR